MNDHAYVCCLCGAEQESFIASNNPYGAKWLDNKNNIISPVFVREQRCCNECNVKYVIPGRLFEVFKDKNNLSVREEK